MVVLFVVAEVVARLIDRRRARRAPTPMPPTPRCSEDLTDDIVPDAEEFEPRAPDDALRRRRPAVVPTDVTDGSPRGRASDASGRCSARRSSRPIAYVDPGNFATNITAGSTYGYMLVWVVIASNLMAMLIQYLSAKAGIATGMSLPALCREHLPRP